jgi:hypothetical protein
MAPGETLSRRPTDVKRAAYGVAWSALLLLLSAACGGSGGDFPSSDEAAREVEHYYATNGPGDPRRPRGELAGCPTRSALRWYDCEFDYPTVAAPTKITCVHVWVAGADTNERAWDRSVVTDIAKARKRARRWGRDSVCSSY